MYLGEIKHPDGFWYTHEHEYKDKKIMLKLRKNHGAKYHIFGDKIITGRFRFISPSDLLKKAQNKIDLMGS